MITGKGPVSSLIATLQTNKFEDKLKAKGLTFEKSGSGVKLKFNGKDMGVFKNPEAIQKALDADNLTKKMYTDIVTEEIPTWRAFKKGKIAKFIRLRYNAIRSIPDSNETDKDKKIQEMQETRVKEANARSTQNALTMMDCLSEGPRCPIDDMKNGEKTTLSSSSEAESAVNQTLTEVGEEGAKEAGEAAAKGTIEAGAKLSTKIATKAIPIVGWIDLAATINHFAMAAEKAAEDDMIVKIPAYFRKVAYAQIYGDWAGYGSQIQEGAMDNDFISVLANQADGIETSQAYACLSNVLSATCSAGVPPKIRVDENNPSAIKKALDKYKDALGFDAPALYQYTPTNLVLEGWYFVSNKITDGATSIFFGSLKFQYSLLNSLTQAITGVDVQSEMTQWLNNVVTKSINSILGVAGLTIDPLDGGADLGNDLLGGGLASFMSFCEDAGCRKLDKKQGYEQDRSIAAEKAEYNASKGWFYNAFSTDSPTSITTQLAAVLPSGLSLNNFDLSSGTSQLASLVSSVPNRLVGSLSGQSASADSTDTLLDLYGFNSFGATAADLDQPVAPQSITGDECPEVPKGAFDLCSWDNMTAEAMMCYYKPEDANCNFATASSAVGGLNVMSYNILGASHGNDGGQSVGTRLNYAIETIRAENPDIMGFQEVSGQRKQLYTALGDTYDAFPLDHETAGSESDGEQDGASRPIYWNKTEFTKIADGTFEADRYHTKNARFPWVALQHTSGTVVYVFNLHASAQNYDNTPGYTPEGSRAMQTNKMLDKIKEVVPAGAPVITTGDYNSTCGGSNTPCEILKAAGFYDSGEVAYQSGHAENYEYNTSHGSAGAKIGQKADGQGRHIDHVFYRDPVQVAAWKNVVTEATKNASDHTPVVAALAVPGISMEGNDADNTTGFRFPLGANDWKKNRADYLNAHTGATGTAWGADSMGTTNKGAGIATDISASVGTAVYAMYGGTVTSVSLCGAGDGVAIKSTVNGKTFGIAYMHGINQTVHLGQKVEAGDKIMDVGERGCQVYGAHLHIGMAYDGKYLCPQDVFLAMDKNSPIDLGALTGKATSTCGGRG